MRPGELLGLPPGVPDLLAQAPALRYLLVGSAVLWALVLARARPWLGLLAGVLFFEVAAGFWVLGLGRPYGLLADPAATRRAAEIGVAAAAGGPEGFLVDVPAPGWWSVRLAHRGVSPFWLLIGPTLLPMVAPVVVALLVHVLARPPEPAARAALLWLAFGTGDLDAVRGVGFLPGLWSRPASAVAFLVAVAGLLLAMRAAPVRRLWIGAAALLIPAAAASPAGVSLPLGGALLALTFDQWIWLVLGGIGLARGADAVARALAAAGAAVLLLGALVPALGLDAWTGHAFYRLGLLLAAAGPAGEWCVRVGEWLKRWPRLAPLRAERLGLAALVTVAVPGAFVTWWDPVAMDPVADESRLPLRPVLTDALAWIRRETPATAVFAASPVHAPAVAALGGRRVLRAPSLVTTADDSERWVLEQHLLEGHAPRRTLPRWGVSHLFLAPGDYADRGLAGPELLDGAPHLRLRYRNAEGYRVYEVVRPTARSPAPAGALPAPGR